MSIYSLWSAQTLFILSTFSGELEDSKLALEFCGVLFLPQIKEPLARIQKWKFKWQVSFEFHLSVSFSALPPPASPWPLLRSQELSEDKREPLCAVGATVLPPLKCRAVCSWRHWPWMHRPPPQLVSASTVPGLGSPSRHRVCAPESLQVLPSKVSSSAVISSFPLSLFAANKSGPYRTIGTWLARKITITKSHKSQNSQPKMLQSYIPPDHPVMIRGFMSNLAARVPCPYVSMGKGKGPSDSEMVALPASSIWWIQQPHWSRMSLCAGGDPAVRRLRPCGPVILWEMLMMLHGATEVIHGMECRNWNVAATNSPVPYSLWDDIMAVQAKKIAENARAFRTVPLWFWENHGAKYSPFCSEIHVFFPMLICHQSKTSEKSVLEHFI